MQCIECGSAAVTERSERTAQGCRRFRCRTPNLRDPERLAELARACAAHQRIAIPGEAMTARIVREMAAEALVGVTSRFARNCTLSPKTQRYQAYAQMEVFE